jgi:transmembrane protein EpsG
VIIYILIILAIFYLSFLSNIIGPIKFKKEILLVLIFVPLFLVSGLRYEVGKDYLNYTYTFNLASNSPNLLTLFSLSQDSTVEFAYLLLNKMVGLLTDNVQWIFFITSFIIIFLVFKTVYQHSSIVWLSIYLFAVGGYIASFNIVRQYIAISLVFYSYKYMKDKNLIKFTLLVITASFFHYSALLILPLYFILNLDLNFKKMLLFSFIGGLIGLFFDPIVNTVQGVFYSEYTSTSYGMTAGNINNVIIAFFYFALAIVFKRPLLARDSSNIILINWSFINFVLSLMSLNIWLITRLMDYSSLFLILLLPEIITSINDKLIKLVLIAIIIFLTLVLFYLNISNPSNMYVPYQFIGSK